MIEERLSIDDPAHNHGEPLPHHDDVGVEDLEQRIHRLEDAVAALQDTQIIEERIAERVLGRVSRKKEVDGRTGIVEAERRVPPPAAAVAAPVSAAVPPPPPPAVAPHRGWVIVEAFRDMRAGLGMFFDSRYRVSWRAYIALMVLAYVLVSHWLWSLWSGIPLLGLLSGPLGVPVLGAILDKALGLLFALCAFKALAREMVHYHEAIPRRPSHYSSY